MKIIKPLRLSVLNRPFRWQGKNHLGVSVLALADMGASPKLRPEAELWQLAAAELQTCGGVIDLAIPKAQAEFLATGYVYSHHQQDKTACAARIEIEQLSKTLAVFGDRYWVNGKPSEPLPFTEMRLDWSRAWGGAGYEDNPHGIGFNMEETDGYKYYRLPNIEPLKGRMTSPRQKPEPAGFGPLDLMWPRRFSRVGKKYDAQWLQNEFPGFARDIDWRLFNAASRDQWWEERDALPPEAEWRIWNMHPEKPVQQGRLPPWRARCFINRQRADETLFEEVPLRATTVWFFPHLEQMIIIWQGNVRINEDDAADVLQLIPALEKNGAARSVHHYRKVMQQRLDKEKGALFAFREKDLLPEEAIGPWLDTDLPESESPMRDNFRQRETLLREQHRARLAEQGADIDAVLPPFEEPEMPGLDELPEFIERMEQRAEEMRADAEARMAPLRAQQNSDEDDEKKPRGPETLYRMQEMLQSNDSGLSEKKLTQMTDALHQMYLMSVQTQPPAPRLKGDIAGIIRQRALATMRLGGDFSGMDFTGADFSGLDLRGADFSRALLECVDFSECQLDGAKFNDAVLARAEFHHSSLRDADLSNATLALAECRHSDFSGVVFNGTQLQEAWFERCCFGGATFNDLLFHKVFFSQLDFRKATLTNSVFLELTLPGLDFSAAGLNKIAFIKCTLEQVDFSRAQMESCSLVESQAVNGNFTAASLTTCAFASGSVLDGANFSHATLLQSNLRQTPLQHACFAQAKIESSDLSEANCQHADFTRANLMGSLCVRTDFRMARLTDSNLMGALMQKSQLGGADLRGANLFRADLSQSSIDESTQLNDAYTKRVKTLPKRDGELI
ncbi:DUF2169 domain-containing protein [Affinibrenneria salicis]|uniref:DUF2169 domain-containing protein n=1 Tax=Affinibrenneria salicis TaxID=2590031 RepID=A0A5J5G767_9GAMM|nr:DUF2169 domain-containing protein [Affinibrenneria salicis]KAA9002626.1 DUF2169 domain-containing protein [Affinibrenneria salicis]KAA9003086.1 DUF2169 domain-containing protein [Affinibrenneria salicis]